MKKLIVKTPAKINLNLHVFPKINKNRLHEVKLVNCQINLFDEISLINQTKKIEVSCQHENICQCAKNDFCRGQKNLIIKTGEILKKYYGRPDLGAEIFVKKHIPPGIGLGGGSANAAAVLQALNKLWKLKLKQNKLLKLAPKLGSDVAYCLVGGLCLVEDTGEKIKKLGFSMPKMWLVIIAPEKEKPSTSWAYKNLDVNKIGKNKNQTTKLIRAIKQNKIKAIVNNLHNDFETLIFKSFPLCFKIKKDFLKMGALNVILAGAGLGMIGFFKNKNEAKKAFAKLEKKYKKAFLCQTL